MGRLLAYITVGLIAASSVRANDAAEGHETRSAPRTTGGYVAPNDPDDYSSLAAWDQRGSWNLANVHDPTVLLNNYIQSGRRNTEEHFDGSWTERAFIGLMETDDLAGNRWVDKGMVVSSASDRGTDWSRKDRRRDWDGYFFFNAIDPAYLQTPGGDHYLVYGSWHSGIAALPIDPATGKPPHALESLEDHGTRVAARFLGNPKNRWQGMEAPETVYNEDTGYYYLFLAYDELSVAYNTRVCRSKSPTGPYLGIDGGNVTEGAECWPLLTHPYRFEDHSGWVGISHCCVFRNEETGEWFYVSQGRLPHDTDGNAYSNAIMMGHLRRIRWTRDGWPVVMPERYAAVPQEPIAAGDLAGTWEHILLDHEYREQRTSAPLVLHPDGRATGALPGAWTYDADRKLLTVGTQQLCVERELDWEASPRVPTIVYAGLNKAGRSLWGKRVAP